MMGIPESAAQTRIARALEGLVRTDELSFAADARALFGADLFHAGLPPAAILRPRNGDRLARCIAAACAAGIPVVPRGGGISYSAGYLAQRDDVLMIDMRGLDAVLHTDLKRATVTVQAGCTWQKLDDHLHALGHRARFRGTASGRDATVGGTLSQEGVLLGSGRFGTAGDNLEALAILTADGRTIAARRGGAVDPAPFVGDCGALGIKIEATLPIMPLPAAATYAAWSFADGHAAIAAQASTAASGLASECFLFDRAWSSRRQGLNPGDSGPADAVPGHRHHRDAHWELHAAFEATSAEAARSALAAFAAICGAKGGEDAGEGVIGYLHRQPFGAPMLLFGPEGKRWVPLHFIVRHDRHGAMGDAVVATMRDHHASIERHGIEWNWSSLLVGRDHVLLEPSLHWPDAQPPQARAYFDAATLARLPQQPANTAARAAVGVLRGALIEAGRAIGARHIQLGRLYPPGAAFAGWSLADLGARKRRLDPHGLMNPGVLGLA